MTRLGKLIRLAVAVAGFSAAISAAAVPITASADYIYWPNTGTHYTTARHPGYVKADEYFDEYPPGGRHWYSEVIFSSTVYTNTWWTTVQFYGGSDAYWWGWSPWCASGIELTDSFGATGIAVSASIPASAGFSGSSSGPITLTSSDTLCNAYVDVTEHQYSQVTLNAFQMLTFDQQSYAKFSFSYSAHWRFAPYEWDWVT
jgi:hypothetical protein